MPEWQAQVHKYAEARDWESAMRVVDRQIEVIQVIEYLRAFLIGREAWAQGNMLTIISGAFGVFRTDLVRAVGGYRSNSIGEDFDLVARMHRHLLEKEIDYQIRFVPDPMCWTEVPSDLRSLGRQRARWYKGLLDVLWPNRDMLFRPRYGRIGCFALPYLWIFELFAPIIEIGGIVTIILAACLGALSRGFFSVHALRLCLRDHDFYWLRPAGRNNLQKV